MTCYKQTRELHITKLIHVYVGVNKEKEIRTSKLATYDYFHFCPSGMLSTRDVVDCKDFGQL